MKQYWSFFKSGKFAFLALFFVSLTVISCDNDDDNNVSPDPPIGCIDSYFNREPTHLMMDAVENSVLWEIPRDIMEELSDANGDIAYLYRSFFENSLMLSQLKADILRFESANDRYARLQQHFPEITRRAPLTMIASYLQMTLETLSRVRASIANAESK